MRADASACIFLRRNIHRFLSRIFLHVKNDDKNNIFVMPIIGKEERKK